MTRPSERALALCLLAVAILLCSLAVLLSGCAAQKPVAATEPIIDCDHCIVVQEK